MNETEIFYPPNVAAWREWLEANHLTKKSVWVAFYAKASGRPTITWSEAVDVALCFGWIDSKKIKIDNETSHQFFSKRKQHSTWSKINKDKVVQLIDRGMMAPAGFESIAIAQQNGSWTVLDEVEALTIPADLETAFDMHPGAQDYYLNLSKSIQKMMLQWLVLAKRPETRQKRIIEIAEQAAQGKKPKQF
ncbi:YdeI/OmpD-associated family protein [Pseudocnuella soli]|uniref:YdeI/OmpD-associated family protein n=1 Tax=Pseudocnuella soli TaxID=2502779 RepID=UPI001052873D|nr:YdeI/OmpD-associated family protein [Pseudocnuella soli]